jgi:hypothetical protein
MLKMGARAGMVRWVSLVTAMGAMFRVLKAVLAGIWRRCASRNASILGTLMGNQAYCADEGEGRRRLSFERARVERGKVATLGCMEHPI